MRLRAGCWPMNPDGTERYDLPGDLSLYVHCYINDVKSLYVVEACEEEGWAEVVVRGDDGLVVFENDQAKTERISCTVKFRPTPELAARDLFYAEHGWEFTPWDAA